MNGKRKREDDEDSDYEVIEDSDSSSDSEHEDPWAFDTDFKGMPSVKGEERTFTFNPLACETHPNILQKGSLFRCDEKIPSPASPRVYYRPLYNTPRMEVADPYAIYNTPPPQSRSRPLTPQAPKRVSTMIYSARERTEMDAEDREQRKIETVFFEKVGEKGKYPYRLGRWGRSLLIPGALKHCGLSKPANDLGPGTFFPSLMELCRESIHMHLIREWVTKHPNTKRDEVHAEAQLKRFTVGLIPELQAFLLADGRLWFHNEEAMAGPFQEELFKCAQDSFEVVPSLYDQPEGYDTHACISCLRGSWDPTHEMRIICIMTNEHCTFSPTYVFNGVKRKYIRGWVCSAQCYQLIKTGLSYIKAMHGVSEVGYPWIVRKLGSTEEFGILMQSFLK